MPVEFFWRFLACQSFKSVTVIQRKVFLKSSCQVKTDFIVSIEEWESEDLKKRGRIE